MTIVRKDEAVSNILLFVIFKVIKWYALQLISLLPSTLGAKIDRVGNKLETPYGLQLKWRLPGGMPFVLHLKDNHKVSHLHVSLYIAC